MLPSVNITFQDGNLGYLPDNTDGLICFVCAGASEGTVTVSNAYVINKLADLKTLGITTAQNAVLVQFVTDFYNNCKEGTPMWFMLLNNTAKPITSIYSANKDLLIKMLRGTKNLATAVFVQPPTGDYLVTQFEYNAFVTLAAQFRTDYLASDNAPVIHCIDWPAYVADNAITAITTAMGCCGYVGDSYPHSAFSFGALAGRYANNSIQRNVGAVADGAVTLQTEQFHGDKHVELMEKTQAIYDANFICLRVHNGLSGYYFTDDRMFMPSTSDYKNLTAVRTIDKAYRIAFAFFTQQLLSELGVNSDGTLRGEVAKDLEARVCKTIKKQMTDLGQLNADPDDPNDFGVLCSVNTKYNTLGNSRLKLNSLQVKPFGYARYIDVPLGFVPVQ